MQTILHTIFLLALTGAHAFSAPARGVRRHGRALPLMTEESPLAKLQALNPFAPKAGAADRSSKEDREELQSAPAADANPLAALIALNPFAKADGDAAAGGGDAAAEDDDDGKMTLEKVASFGVAGVLSIALAETVFWVLSFPTSELLYYASTGEWIDLLTQEGQLKFLAFTAGWGAVGGVIAQYRTVLTAAAVTPWMDRTVVKPYVNPLLAKFGKGEDGEADAE